MISLWQQVVAHSGVAASILLAVTLALGAIGVRQRLIIESLHQQQDTTEAAHAQQLAELDRQHRQEDETRVGELARLRREKEEIEHRLHGQRTGKNEPLINVPFAWLIPAEPVRGQAHGVVVPAEAGQLVIILESTETQVHQSYRLDIVREQSGETIWRGRGLRPVTPYAVSVVMPSDILAPGRYRLSLYAPDGSGERLVAQYLLELTPG